MPQHLLPAPAETITLRIVRVGVRWRIDATTPRGQIPLGTIYYTLTSTIADVRAMVDALPGRVIWVPGDEP